MSLRLATKAVARLVQQHGKHPVSSLVSAVAHQQTTRDSLRALLRNTAQPVAVVTSLMPPAPSASSGSSHGDLSDATQTQTYHGATLSSFTSIAMDPYPLVAFALRIPSRMATALKAACPDQPSDVVVNLLSAEQSSVAVTFSRPDLHPRPFTSVPYTLTEDGLPVITGSLGAMSCKLISTAFPLHDLEYIKHGPLLGKGAPEPVRVGEDPVSELFIAQVTRVEGLDVAEDPDASKQPLLYYHRHYTTVSPIPKRTST